MGENWAIAIGINDYENLQNLNYAQRDAEAMETWFREAYFDQVFLFTKDSPPNTLTTPAFPTEPTYGYLRRFFRAQFEKPQLKAGDNLWFFFAGHGKRYHNRDYLMLSDSDPGDIEHSALSVSWITERLRRWGADNVVMFLDACRDTGARNGIGIGTEKQPGVITFYACSPNQQSYEIEQLSHGSFTHSLLESLKIQGEGNCATVERLYQRLRYRVSQINRKYERPLQEPYAVIEPATKYHLILLPDYATLADIAQLKLDAYQAEVKNDWELARQLWIRVNVAARGSDVEAIEAFSRITQRQSSTTDSNNLTSSTGERGTTTETAAQTEQQHQQNLLQYRNSFSQAVFREFPLSRASRKRLRYLQQYLQLTDKEVSQIEKPIIAPKEEERRQQQEQERIRQQQEAEQLRQQREAEKSRKREERQRQQQQQLEKIQQLFTSITSRRKFLQWAGLGGGGLAIAVVGREMFKGSLVAEPEYIPPTEGALWTVKFETVTVNAKGEVVKPNSKKEAKFFKEDLGNGVILEMVSIPRDSFKMGSPPGEKGRDDDEEPQHNVTVPAFFMGRYQVTQEQYQQVMSKNPSFFKGDKLPVERVSWNDAVKFCKELNKKTVQKGLTYRLPSEAEWEYACRANTTTPFHFGETITTDLVNYGNNTYASAPKGKYRRSTTEVGQFPPNAFGLYDMHGNIWEWCQDTWHDNYNDAPNNGNAWVETDRNDNPSRLLRGGSWQHVPDYCRSANRYSLDPNWASNSLGLRVVCVVASRT